MNTVAIVFDAVLAFIILYNFIKDWKRGFLSSLLKTFGFFIACFAGYVGSRALAETVYQLFLRQNIIKSVENALVNSAFSNDVSIAVDSVMGTVPKAFQGFFLNFFGGNEGLNKEVGSLISGSAQSVSISLTDQIVYPIVFTVLQASFFILLFFAVMVFVRIFIRALKGVKHLPLIGPVNSLLGGVMGVFQGILTIVIIVLILHFVIGMTGNQVSYLNEDVINNTYIFKYFYNWNPVGGISVSTGSLGFEDLMF